MPINNNIKKGWYWEEMLIQKQTQGDTGSGPDGSLTLLLNCPSYDPDLYLGIVDETEYTESTLPDVLPAGGILIDMSLWGLPAEYDILNPMQNNFAQGLDSGVYEVSARYYGVNGMQGSKVWPSVNSFSTNLCVPPRNEDYLGGNDNQEMSAIGPSCLKMNAYLRLYDENQIYAYNDQAIGINIYLKQTETFDGIPVTGDEYRICECSFEHGWRKTGDPTTGIITEYTPYSEINFEDNDGPGIVSFTGDIGSTYNNTSQTAFTYLGRPTETFYQVAGYESNIGGGTDLYRWKDAVIHEKSSWIGNTAKIEQSFDPAGNVSYDTGTIQKINGDSLHKSAHRVYDVYTDNSAVDVVNRDGDSIIALQEIADRIYVCKENAVHIVNTSQEDHYYEDSLTISPLGKNCIAKTPHGICFLTRKGVYLHTENSLIDLTENKINMRVFWREADYTLPFEVQRLQPMMGYNSETDELFIYLSASNNVDFASEHIWDQETETWTEWSDDYSDDWMHDIVDIVQHHWFWDNEGIGWDLTGDGLLNADDYQFVHDNLHLFEYIQNYAYDKYIYSFTNNTWTSSLPESQVEQSIHRTNFVNYESKLAFYNSEDGYIYAWDKSAKSSSNNSKPCNLSSAFSGLEPSTSSMNSSGIYIIPSYPDKLFLLFT